MSLPVLAVTSGEPAGIGPDICLDLAFAELPCRPVVLGDKGLLAQRAEMLGKNVVLRDFVSGNADKVPLCMGNWKFCIFRLPRLAKQAGSIPPMRVMSCNCWTRHIKALPKAYSTAW